MHSWKLMLTALGTAALLGTIGGTTMSPTMKPAPDQPWRRGLGPQETPVPTYAIVETGPQDLSPQGWTYGAARAFPREDWRSGTRQQAYRLEDQAPAETADTWSYADAAEDEAVRPGEAAPVTIEAPAIEAAEAARDAALAAQDAPAVAIVAPDA